MDPQRKKQILKLLSFDAMIKDYLRQPCKKSNKGVSNIQKRCNNLKSDHNLTSNYATVQPQAKKEKRSFSTQSMHRKTINNPIKSNSNALFTKKKAESTRAINKTQKVLMHQTSHHQSETSKKMHNSVRVHDHQKQKSELNLTNEADHLNKNQRNTFETLESCNHELENGKLSGKLPHSKQPKRNHMRIFKSGLQCQDQQGCLNEDMMGTLKEKKRKLQEGNSLKPSQNYQLKSKKEKQVILKGRYKLEKIIGRGLSGTVYRAHDILSDRKVAVKMINPENVEYEFIKNLDHPNLIKYYNSFLEKFEGKEKRYLVLEYFPLNLAEVVRKQRLADQDVKNIFRSICGGVMYLHSLSFAHRDIKLENIVCSEDFSVVKFIDFGLCLDISGIDGKESRRFCGTTHYMAPEVITGQCDNPKKADIWSLGVALYVLKIGRPPFSGRQEVETYNKIKNSKTIFPADMDENLKELLSKMLEKNPEKRISIFEVLHHRWLSEESM